VKQEYFSFGYIDEVTWERPRELPNLSGTETIALDTETYDPSLLDRGPGWDIGSGELVGVSLAVSRTQAWYLPIKTRWNDGFDLHVVVGWLNDVFDEHTTMVGANLTYDLGWLTHYGFNLRCKLFDVLFCAALIDEHLPSYSLDAVASAYGVEGKVTEELYEWCARTFGGSVGPNQREHIYHAPVNLVGPYAEADAYVPLLIREQQLPIIEHQNLGAVVELEHDLVPLLIAMRRRGVRVDVAARDELSDYIGKRLSAAAGTVYNVAGNINVNSSKELASVFDAHGWDYPTLPPTAKEKERAERLGVEAAHKPSFKKDWLLSQDNEFAKAVADMRRLDKIKGTFVDGYFDLAHKERLHCTLHPLRTGENGTVSGRLSCIPEYVEILTKEGPIPFSNVSIGDSVLTHTGHHRRVTNKWFTGYVETYRIILTNGAVLDCTADHRIMTSFGWMELGDIHEYLQECNRKHGGMQEGGGSVPRGEKTNRQGSECNDRHNLSNSPTHTAEAFAGRCVQKGKKPSLRTKQAREAESYAREAREPTPQLQRGMRNRGRVPDCNNTSLGDGQACWDYADVSPPSSYSGSNGVDGDTSWVRCASHKRCHNGQQTRELSLTVAVSPCTDSPPHATVRRIERLGVLPVFDMEVETDHTYYAGGLLVHNCSLPNLQNIPSRDPEFGPRVRGLFIPEEGEVWASQDYSQIELKFLAHYAVGAGAEETRRMLNKDRSIDFHEMVMERTGLPRKPAKTVSFSLCIAEDELVATEKGLVPIQYVTRDLRVWDGVTWVEHDGVVCVGEKSVITYDGLTATPDHKVYVVGDDNPIPLREAAARGLSLQRPVGSRHCGEGASGTALVYDIVNAGPRHRFTVSGVLVSNCYGSGIANTANLLGCTEEEAKAFRDAHFAGMPFMKSTFDQCTHVASTRGYLFTIMGRRARFPFWEANRFMLPEDVRDEAQELGNFNSKYACEEAVKRLIGADMYTGSMVQRARTYKALNSLLQGSAADLMKKAMADIWSSGICDVLGAPLLTVHDELNWSKPRTKEGDEAIREAAHIMETAIQLNVPVTVSCEEGMDWGHLEDVTYKETI